MELFTFFDKIKSAAISCNYVFRLERTVKRQNQTFVCAEPSHLNACVGENGNPNYVQYAIGFSQAANIDNLDCVGTSTNPFCKKNSLIF